MRSGLALAVVAASAVALVGCSSGGAARSDETGPVPVVASTNVYGQIAEEIGGEFVDVASIVSSSAQDPHSFEASARDQLAISRAALIVENGGGYDTFIETLIEASRTTAPVITAVEYSAGWTDAAGEKAGNDVQHEHDHAEGANEHIWYDLSTMAAVAGAIADQLAEFDLENADVFQANAEEFQGQVGELTSELDALAADHAGEKIFVTEPVPLYLTDAAGLENVAPDAFSEAVEEGQDVPPASLLDSLDLLSSGDVRVVVVNAQTGGAETARIIDAAQRDGIPVLDFSETLPEGSTYVAWMQRNIDDLAGALAA